MYLPPHFQEHDPERIREFCEAHPLASLFTKRADVWDANPLPFLWTHQESLDWVLEGHLARANPVVRGYQTGETCLVHFRGPDGYISPQWYPSKANNANQVPTWNYQAVNVRGTLELVDDDQVLQGILRRLVARHEAPFPHPWSLDDPEPDFLASMRQGIIAIRVHVQNLEAKFKLSQNRSPEDARGAAEGARHNGSSFLSLAMSEAYAQKPKEKNHDQGGGSRR